MEHLLHPNNNVPHFLHYVVGSIDTFPIEVKQGKGRFQPKYKSAAEKFQCVVSNLGLLAHLTGPHPHANQTSGEPYPMPPEYVADQQYLSQLHAKKATPIAGLRNGCSWNVVGGDGGLWFSSVAFWVCPLISPATSLYLKVPGDLSNDCVAFCENTRPHWNGVSR